MLARNASIDDIASVARANINFILDWWDPEEIEEYYWELSHLWQSSV